MLHNLCKIQYGMSYTLVSLSQDVCRCMKKH